MTNEVFRASNVCVSGRGKNDLELLNLSLYEGEVLGIWGNYRAGKSKLFDVIAGKVPPASGAIFWAGRKDGKPPAILTINGDSGIIDELSVWENFAVLWGNHVSIKPLRSRQLKSMATLLLEDFDISIDINRKAASLSQMERLMLEMIMGYWSRAKLILIDITEIKSTMQEYQRMKALLKELKKEGISAIVFSHQMQEVIFLSDRFGVLHNGRIIKLVDRAAITREMLSTLEMALYQNAKQLEKKQQAGTEWVLRLAHLNASPSAPLSLSLEPGEFMAVISPHTDLFQILARRVLDGDQEKACQLILNGKRIKRLDRENGIVFLNMGLLDQLIEEITPLENLCLGIVKRAGFWGVDQRKIVQCVERDFYEWYGHSGLLQQKDCRTLCREDRAAINLFRMRFQHQTVIFCDDVSIHNDLTIYHMIREELAALAEAGTAVCMMTSDPAYSDELVKRYLMLDHKQDAGPFESGTPM